MKSLVISITTKNHSLFKEHNNLLKKGCHKLSFKQQYSRTLPNYKLLITSILNILFQ